ncbi:MAG: transcription termination factor Rho [Desulfobacterium sp.]|nr:transcription termination factor Rho [Desulfobacterium sp.]MBU3949575.1 Rho termination factor N-terminal domain-containing protein [Pseudomonadota bacterium]MBU4037005.1 Rho termination factor N-terminal domain-containing protein [Pseudomonadota bacterium]
MGSKKKAVKEKPLDKMTAKELREVAINTPGVTGAHGMNKDELISTIKEAKGIVEAPSKKSNATIRELKASIKEIKTKHAAAIGDDNSKMARIYRSRVIKLKKKTRV